MLNHAQIAHSGAQESLSMGGKKPYQQPEVIVWGTLLALTKGPEFGFDSDQDFTGSPAT